MPRSFPYLVILGLALVLAISPRASGLTFSDIEAKARDLAAKPFVPMDDDVPDVDSDMDYGAYQNIKFNKAQTIWANTPLPFRLEMFYRAFLFPEHVKINVVGADGSVQDIPFAPEMFTYDSPTGAKLPPVPPNYGFAGLKVFHQFSAPRSWEEMIIFQGASYFRIPATQQVFGLSARAITINSGIKGTSEEFPAFTEFWVVQPTSDTDSITIYALLDGASVTGAYQFVVHPTETTTEADVTATFVFRAAPGTVGYAPLTSMFWYGGDTYHHGPTYRPQVHDSEGLLLAAADGSRQWRPLQTLTEDLVDRYHFVQSPRGFGLMQRTRDFNSYADLEAEYQRRPSLWVEPQGDWSNGSVLLWQMPTVDEYHDNVVAYWMPPHTPKAGESRTIRYRLLTTIGEPDGLPSSGQVLGTYISPSAGQPDRYQIMVDFAWDGDAPPAKVPDIHASCEGGKILAQYVKPNADNHSWRLYTVVQFPSAKMKAALRYGLTGPKGWKSEEWIYTFVPQESLPPSS